MRGATLTKSQVALALIGLAVSVIAVIPAYWRIWILTEQVRIMRQSLERKPNLVMAVVPSCVWRVGELPNGTRGRRKSELTLSRTNNFTFMVYVSNVGDAFAHLLYYYVHLSCDSEPRYRHIDIPFIETVVLSPHGSTSFEYVFGPSCMPSEVLSSTYSMNFTFAVGSAETEIYEVIHTHF